MTAPQLSRIQDLLRECSKDERYEVFRKLRQEFPIHEIELRWNAPAEVILEAIARSPDLTLRGVRGVIADAAFGSYVIPKIEEFGWTNVSPKGNFSYDYAVTDGKGEIKVQVKMQRLKDHRPMMANEGYKRLPADHFVVETQRTRGGKDPATGADTRPYRYGEFDILAVSMHPSSDSWDRFMFTVADWLLPSPVVDHILKFQPVSPIPNSDWTDSFLQSVDWLRSGLKKRIAGA